MIQQRPASPTCRCGHGPDHHLVEVSLSYGFWAWFALLSGITGTPKKATWRCRRCGEVLKQTRDPRRSKPSASPA